MMIDMLGEAMLQSNMPEEQKLPIRVLLSVKKLKEKLDSIIEPICDPEIETTEEVTQARQVALALLDSLTTQLDNGAINFHS